MHHQDIQLNINNIHSITSAELLVYLQQPMITLSHLDCILFRQEILIRENNGDVNEANRLQRISDRLKEITSRRALSMIQSRKNQRNMRREDAPNSLTLKNETPPVHPLEIKDILLKIMNYFSFEDRQFFKSVSSYFEQVINEMPIKEKFLFCEQGFIICIDRLHEYQTAPSYKQLQANKNLRKFAKESDGLTNFYVDKMKAEAEKKIPVIFKGHRFFITMSVLIVLAQLWSAPEIKRQQDSHHTHPARTSNNSMLGTELMLALFIYALRTVYYSYQQYTARKNARQLFGFFVDESSESKVESIADENLIRKFRVL